MEINWIVASPLLFFLPALVYPVLEELTFRGLLQGWLIKQYSNHLFGLSCANLMTSLLFTALHFFNHNPIAAALVFVPSLVFGYFRDRYHGWLAPPVILHIYYNSGYFLLFHPVS